MGPVDGLDDASFLSCCPPTCFKNLVVEYVVKIAEDTIHADPTQYLSLAIDDANDESEAIAEDDDDDDDDAVATATRGRDMDEREGAAGEDISRAVAMLVRLP
jgi:hypothetical protein